MLWLFAEIRQTMVLRQILVNLVGNAVKFTEKGEAVVAVSIASQMLPDRVMLHLTIADTGIYGTSIGVNYTFGTR